MWWPSRWWRKPDMLIAPLNESMNSEFSSISTLNEFRSDTYSTQSDCDEAFILRKCKSILQMDTIYLSPSMYPNQLGRLNEAKGLFVKNSSQIVYKMVVSSGMREKLHMIVYNRIPDFRNNGHSLIPNNSLEQFSEREKNRQVNKKHSGRNSRMVIRKWRKRRWQREIFEYFIYGITWSRHTAILSYRYRSVEREQHFM